MMLDEAALDNLITLYRALSTEQLRDYRTALEQDRDRARRSRRLAKYSLEFSTSRIAAINQVLGQRGLRG